MPLDTRLQDSPLGLNPTQACFEDTAARSFHPGIPLPELGKLYTAELQSRCLQPTPPPFQSLLNGYDDKKSCRKQFSQSKIRSWCAAAATTTRPQQNGALLESSQKRLLIFDQSGNETCLLRCPFLPLRFPSPTAAEPVKLSGLEKVFREEDCVTSKEYDDDLESEMHEDTEEINALLYSDDDYDDDCESDDEVMSTGHSPEQVCNNKRQLEEEEEEEIDGPPHRKKQKLLDNISDSSSLVGTKLNGSSFLKDNNLLESNIPSKEDDTGSGSGSGLSNEQSRKDKIRTALKILESVIPGAAKGNEALLLLDEAIDYLKLLKRDLISTVTSHHSC